MIFMVTIIQKITHLEDSLILPSENNRDAHSEQKVRVGGGWVDENGNAAPKSCLR